MESLVSTDWLADHLEDDELRIADASWYMPEERRNARHEFEQEHIPGAVFIDIDALASRSSPLPHTFPTARTFADYVGERGIGNEHRVVIYDGDSHMAAARVWWMFRAFGHERVAVLDGGLGKWKAEQRPLQRGTPPMRGAQFAPVPHDHMVCEIDEMRQIVEEQSRQIADARSPGRFEGVEPEPRQGLRSGHMPGAKNIPASTLFNKDGTYKTGREIRDIFQQAGIDPDKPVATTCGSGVTASTLLFGLCRAGADADKMCLYDGSWTEWGGQDDTPVDTSQARGA